MDTIFLPLLPHLRIYAWNKWKMAQNDRLAVFPSRANSVIMKQRVLSAKRGMGLLKRKRDAIDMQLREIRKRMMEHEEDVDEKMRKAIFSVAKANLLGTDFKPLIVADSSRTAKTIIRRNQQKIVGVTLNNFVLDTNQDGDEAFPMAGLNCGGVQVKTMRSNFHDALVVLIEYASMEYMVRMLKEASHQTNMRVNALDHILIPRLINTYTYITGELEEYEREDFYRLKRSQAKQLEAKIAFSELIKTKNMTTDELTDYRKRGTFVHPVADVNFDSDEFNEQIVWERLVRARLERQIRSVKQLDEADEATYPVASSFITTHSILQFIQQTARARDPLSSRGSLYSHKRMLLETKLTQGPRKSPHRPLKSDSSDSDDSD
ncbi:V-type proton ATPase subunit D [Drosophila tropicalis]|uniref:V-type proton ATPase subunit D n=1 Tax=Drosophila tropicalis TaxID=46794 RepID=UPI0035ABE86A